MIEYTAHAYGKIFDQTLNPDESSYLFSDECGCLHQEKITKAGTPYPFILVSGEDYRAIHPFFAYNLTY